MRKAGTLALLAAAGLLPFWLMASGLADEENYGPFKPVQTSRGTVLADGNGKTVYTYDKDTKNKSNCYGPCAASWPPVLATATARPVGDLTISERADGTRQWGDAGKPLYTSVKDKKPGDVAGDMTGNVWHIIKEH